MAGSRKRKSERESYVSESYRSVVVRPYQATMRICFCCKVVRAPLIIIVICLLLEMIRAILFAYLTYIPGVFSVHFLANCLIMLLGFAMFGQSLLVKSLKITGYLMKIYSIGRM